MKTKTKNVRSKKTANLKSSKKLRMGYPPIIKRCGIILVIKNKIQEKVKSDKASTLETFSWCYTKKQSTKCTRYCKF